MTYTQAFDLNGNTPPQAVALEESVLGALMLDQTALINAIETLHVEYFYKEEHQAIYRAIRKLFEMSQPVDIPVHNLVDVELHTHHYKAAMKAKLMHVHEEKDGWKFVFLGANIDAVAEADSLGISKDNAVKYKNSASGVRSNYEAVVEFTQEAMAPSEDGVAGSSGSWKKKIEKDED